MTGLRAYERDLALPERFGHRVVLRDGDGLLRRVREHLLSGSLDATAASCVFVRWKPHVALASTWEVTLTDGSTRWVTHKAYEGDKKRHLLEHCQADDHATGAAAPLEPLALLEDEGAYLAAFPVDRVLRGAGRVANLRRTARHLDRAGIWDGWVMRLRASHLEPLRYKPERRAVLRLRAKLRDETGGRRELTLAVRVLPPQQARSIARARGALDLSFAPRLLAGDLDAGVLFEEWLIGEVPEASTERDEAAGAMLAQLHGQRIGAPRPVGRADRGTGELVRVAGLAASLPELEPMPLRSPMGWVHGDFHPDQILADGDRRFLLDLDTLRPGVPEEDLAGWIATRLAEDPDRSWSELSEPLLAGYCAAGGTYDGEELRLRVAHALVASAEGALRRLERGALERAATLLDRSASIGEGEQA